jgi:predicted CoA-binding protein
LEDPIMAVTGESIRQFVSGKTVAMVGVSADGKKFGSYAYAELKKRGYKVLPVHPTAEAIQGAACWRSLLELPERVENVLVVVKPDRAEAVVREAAAAGARRVWLQQGAESPEALRACGQLGLDVIHGQCILMFAEPVGPLHGIHRWIWKVIGKIPR